MNIPQYMCYDKNNYPVTKVLLENALEIKIVNDKTKIGKGRVIANTAFQKICLNKYIWFIQGVGSKWPL